MSVWCQIDIRILCVIFCHMMSLWYIYNTVYIYIQLHGMYIVEVTNEYGVVTPPPINPQWYAIIVSSLPLLTGNLGGTSHVICY